LIALERLHKTYPARGGARHAAVTALDDVSLHVQPGEIFGVIGRSAPARAP